MVSLLCMDNHSKHRVCHENEVSFVNSDTPNAVLPETIVRDNGTILPITPPTQYHLRKTYMHTPYLTTFTKKNTIFL